MMRRALLLLALAAAAMVLAAWESRQTKAPCCLPARALLPDTLIFLNQP